MNAVFKISNQEITTESQGEEETTEAVSKEEETTKSEQ